MKRKGPAFGHSQVDYRLGNIFKRAAKEFEEADAADKAVEDEYQRAKGTLNPLESIRMPERMFAASGRRMEAGVVLLMAAAAFLEQNINDYAHTFLDADWYAEHLDNLRTVTKWILLPHLCQRKEVSENDPVINALREFIKARNAVVHHKRRDFYLDLHKASNRTSTESARFLSACRKAESTVDALIKILTSPPPGAKKPETATGKQATST